jgi:hypothetical protein
MGPKAVFCGDWRVVHGRAPCYSRALRETDNNTGNPPLSRDQKNGRQEDGFVVCPRLQTRLKEPGLVERQTVTWSWNKLRLCASPMVAQL